MNVITDKELAKIHVRRIIFHDVPYNRKGGRSEPKLANTETKIDAERAAMLRRRLVQVLGSKSAYPICFWSSSQSPIPDEVRAFTGDHQGAKKFVEMSQKLARYLFELQTGAMSPGLLCVIDCVVGGDSAVAVLKLEREQGVELEMKEEDGKRSFEIEVLDDLVLTDGTRLFKSALFIRKGAGNDDFKAAAREAGVPRQTCLHRRRQGRTNWSWTGYFPLAGFEVITAGRF